MHSSTLRGTDFMICIKGSLCDHAEYFKDFKNTARLGLLTPDGLEGVGAINLVMAYVTAFYDTYRAVSDDFFAYPDYFSFQSRMPLADYKMFDIWPDHKNVHVPDDPKSRLNAINDRGINILLLPDKSPTDHSYERPQLESARRNITRCYVYAMSGQMAHAGMTIQSQNPALLEWAQSVFETAVFAQNPTIQQQKSAWLAQHTDKPNLTQSFRRISLAEALTRL